MNAPGVEGGIVKTIKNLKCILSEDEIREAGAQMANAFKLLKSDQDNLKSAQAEFKASIAGHEAAVNLYANRIQSGFEYRDVECQEIEDGLSIRTIRTDTGETVEMRAMSAAEQQRKFEFERENPSGSVPFGPGKHTIVEAEFYIDGERNQAIEYKPEEDQGNETQTEDEVF